MVLAVGSKYELSYIAEVSYGITPDTPSMRKLRVTGDSLNLKKDSFMSNELRSDREVSDFRHGNRQVEGPLNFELSFDQGFDDYFKAFLGASDWTTAATISANTIAFVNGTPDTITDSANGFVLAGFKIGDSITITNSARNNTTVSVTNVAAGTLTLGGTTIVSEPVHATITATTIAFVNGTPDTITDSGNGFVTAGFGVDDVITVSGSANNNVTVTVTAVAAGVLTVNGTAIVDEVAGATVTIAKAVKTPTIVSSRKYAKTGVSVHSFSMERRFTDIGLFQQLTGDRVNGLDLSVKPNSIVTGSFTMMGKDWLNATESLDDTPDSASTNPPFDSFSGAIYENDILIAVVTGVDLKGDNKLDPAFVVGSPVLQQIFEQRCEITGTLTAWLQDEVIVEKFKNETITSLVFRLTDGTNWYEFNIPRLKYSDASAPVSGFGGVTVTLPFTAYLDPTVGASLRIDKSS